MKFSYFWTDVIPTSYEEMDGALVTSHELEVRCLLNEGYLFARVQRDPDLPIDSILTEDKNEPFVVLVDLLWSFS